jgi:hypothetical protein
MGTTALPNQRVNLTGQNDAPGKLPTRSRRLRRNQENMKYMNGCYGQFL